VLDEIDNIAGWLFTVAKNKVIDWYRKKRLDTVPIHESEEDQLTLEELLSDETDDTWDDETKELVNVAIIDAIDDLPEKQKYVFVQQVVEERTFKEIAEELGESINTVIARKRYAVQFLQRELKEIRDMIKD
jgi:RNA polymerase sigma factor (sigma-70 family)